ncbi:unnamed protein product [Effrenium voratum]|nr:unnamed protein product [Effrenium voratum]
MVRESSSPRKPSQSRHLAAGQVTQCRYLKWLAEDSSLLVEGWRPLRVSSVNPLGVQIAPRSFRAALAGSTRRLPADISRAKLSHSTEGVGQVMTMFLGDIAGAKLRKERSHVIWRQPPSTGSHAMSICALSAKNHTARVPFSQLDLRSPVTGLDDSLMLCLILAALVEASVSRTADATNAAAAAAAKAASGAASYWRGSRVRAEEELNLPAPQIQLAPNGSLSIEYNGYSLVQECLEYYLDKSLEQKNQQRVYERELEAKQARAKLSHRPRGVMVYLLMENADRTLHKDLALSLRCLARFFWKYPVVIFHTNSSLSSELAWLQAAAPSVSLSFEEVRLDFPEELWRYPGGPDAYLKPPLCMLDGRHWWSSHRSCGCRCPAWRPQCWPLNWLHAAHFFTVSMFRTKTFQEGGYEFFFRVDTDLFFVEEPVVDPFELMAESGCVMVYDRLSREAPGCFDDFDARCMEYLDRIGYTGDPDLDLLSVGGPSGTLASSRPLCTCSLRTSWPAASTPTAGQSS